MSKEVLGSSEQGQAQAEKLTLVLAVRNYV